MSIKSRRSRPRASQRLVGAPIVLTLGFVAAGCHEPLDTTRKTQPNATLGDDLYGLFCDRLGSSALSEDLTGASYNSICRFDARGEYGSHVDASQLPPPGSEASAKARALSIAKLERLAENRPSLIRAINAAFPDIAIDNPATPDPTDKIRLHDALMALGQNVIPLYESNPYNSKAEPLLPEVTRSLGRLFERLAESPPALQALSNISGRQGYRPFDVALGAVRAALAYPALRSMTEASLPLLGPDGTALPELRQFLKVMNAELRTSTPVVALLPNLVVNNALWEPNRPRSNIEFASRFLLAEDEVFAGSGASSFRFISKRDRRGFVVPVGNEPGVMGTVLTPFADLNQDGFADVDGGGRFVDLNGAPLAAPSPFGIPGVPTVELDTFGRPNIPFYQYIDTNRTLVASLARTILPLFDATSAGPPNDPFAWRNEHETLMYQMAGAYVLFGDREPAKYDYATETILPPDAACDTCIAYNRFRGETSPLADVAHAMGQLLADRDSDVILQALIELVEQHEDVVARLAGAGLRAREIAANHDDLAAQGLEPRAEIPYETPVWDEMAQILDKMVDRPGFVERLLATQADDTMVTPMGTSKHMGETLAVFMKMRDQMTYDRNNLNGPAVNLSVGGGSTADPEVPVDRLAPLRDLNRSLFERSIQMIHDADGAKTCNKQGSELHMDLAGIPTVDYPLFGTMDECELFSIENLATFYLRALLPAGHPMKAALHLKDTLLSGAMDLIGNFKDPDQMMEEMSGINGMSLHPNYYGLNRFVFFGADSSTYLSMPDIDFQNGGTKTNKFISKLTDPVSTSVCPKDPLGVNSCPSEAGLMRVRHQPGTSLAWERLGFLDYLTPLVTMLANESCPTGPNDCDTNDEASLKLFLDVLGVLHTHWPTKDHGSYCVKSGTAATNRAYCSEAGLGNYEPLMADVFASDLMPAIHAFAKVAVDFKTTVRRGPDAGKPLGGTAILANLQRIMFSQKYGASVGLTDRQGNAKAKWVDGTPQAQHTLFTLMADALHGIDTRFDSACAPGDVGCRADVDNRKAQWKHARSQLVDTLLSVDGTGTEAHFRNRATPKVLVTLLKTLREQLNAHCKDREGSGSCDWARRELGQKVATTLSGPLFAAIMDLNEKVRQNEPARRELERFVTYLLAQDSPDSLQGTLASAADLMQLLASDGDLSPIFNAVADVTRPAGDPAGSGCLEMTVHSMKALVSDGYDQFHALDTILPKLVTPIDGGQNRSPIEIIMDAIGDVNRIDASSTTPFGPADYARVMKTVREFLVDDTRGLEQFYYIVQHRPR